MAGFGAVRYDGFLSPQVFLNLLIDNAFLCIVAVGMTFVILSGGIDLSVGAVIALTTMISASLVERRLEPVAAMPLVLALGALFGALHGLADPALRPAAVHRDAGRHVPGARAVLPDQHRIHQRSTTSVYAAMAQARIPLGLRRLALDRRADRAASWSRQASGSRTATEFGRTVYAIGGGETSARADGPAGGLAPWCGVYMLSGFCAALAGVVMTLLHALRLQPACASGLELDAIAAVVIGGTLLAGGVGYVAGTLFGVLILGIIQTLIAFDGTLSSWWTRIVVGALLLAFCLLQRFFEVRDPAK